MAARFARRIKLLFLSLTLAASLLFLSPLALAAPYGTGGYGSCDYNSQTCDANGNALANTGDSTLFYTVGAVIIIVAAVLIFLSFRSRKK